MNRSSFAWLKQFARAFRRGLARRDRLARRRFTPTLDALEQRTVPANLVVTTTADAAAVNPAVSELTASGDVSLRSAVQRADFLGGTNSITLPSAAPPYKLTLTGTGEDQATTGDLDIDNLGGNAAAFNLTIQGGGAATTIIDGNLTDRVFQIFPNVTVSLTGVTVQNGLAPSGDTGLGGPRDSFGGGILNEGSLTLTDCVVQNNAAQGLSVDGTSNLLAGNGSGGGMFTSGPSLTLLRTRVLTNQALGGQATAEAGTGEAAFGGTGAGGGIGCPGFTGSGRFAGTITLTDSTVSDNRAQGGNASDNSTNDYGGQAGDGDGGGLSVPGGTVNINSSTVALNRAVGGTGQTGFAVFGNGNGTGNGGGIDNNAVLTLSNSTVSSNQATTDGGGIRESIPEDLVLHNDTITANVADSDGVDGGDGGGVWSDGFITVQSTILAGNFDNTPAPGSVNPDVTLTGSVTDEGFNLIGDATGSGGNFTAGTDQLNVAPGLLPLGNYGGLTETHALQLSSPAIDKGSNPDGLTFDQRGSPFVRTAGPQTDVGAYEVQNGSLSGTVYRDNNDNGIFEPGLGETGIANVTLTLTGTDLRGVPVNLTALTGPTGAYSFPGVRPSNAAGYTLTQTQPAGFLPGKNAVGTVNGVATGTLANAYADTVSAIVIGDGGNGVGYNFGELVPASVAGFVYLDTNNNGVFEPALGETGIQGVTVTLTGTTDQGTGVNQAVPTDGGGAYGFANLRPGVYTLTETPPAGFLPGKATQGTPGNGTVLPGQFANITLAAGVNGANNDFGQLPPSPPPPPPPPPPATAQLSGLVFRDDNGDGVFEPQLGEAGLPNVSVSIKMVGDPTVLTSADGTFTFTGLPPGTYVLTVTSPAGFIPVRATPGSAGGTVVNNGQITGITLAAGTAATGYVFAELPTGALGNYAAAVIVPNIVASAVPPTLLGKLGLLGSSVVAGSTASLQGYAAYVNGLYQDVLARVPSTADLNFWVSRLLTGETRAQVAAEFWTSPEHRGLQVDRFYQLFLHRTEDSAGRTFWVNVFLGGASETDVAVSFLTSPEYLAHAGGVESFVGSVYRDVLGRALDPAGRAYWVGGVQAGRFTLADVARGVVTSDEALTDIIALAYARYLRRPLDATGAAFWLAELRRDQSPTLMAELLLASDEYLRLPR